MVTSLLLSFLSLCLITPCFAADISLTVDKASLLEENGKNIYTTTIGRPFIIKIIAATNRMTGDIEIGGLNRLSVMGQSSSSKMTSVNGTVSRQTIYNVTVMSDQEGFFTIGPARATINGKKTSSNKVAIRISKNTQVNNQGNDNKPEETTAFCRLLVDDTSAIVGQPIAASLKIYTRGPIRNIHLASTPRFPGFLSKEIKHAHSKQEILEGEEYNVTEKKYILFPLQKGKKTIDPISVIVDIPAQTRPSRRRGFLSEEFMADFFGPQISRRQIKTSPVAITVSSVPNYKKRVDGVGTFTSFNASMDKNKAAINEPITLNLSIEGKGNLDQLAKPKLRLPKGFKYYDSKATISENLDVNYAGGKKTFEFILQANKPGRLTLPTQSFTFYDTQAKRFKTLTTSPVTLEIEIPEGYNPPTNQKKQTQKPVATDKQQEVPTASKPTEDVHFIQEHTKSTTTKSIPWWLFILLLLIPFLAYQKAFIARINLFLKSFSGKKSLTRFNDQLNSIIKNRQAIKLHNFFMHFFATKYDVSINQVTQDWITITLLKEGWSPAKVDEFVDYLNVCAGLHFASHTKQEDKTLLKRAHYWLLILNK